MLLLVAALALTIDGNLDDAFWKTVPVRSLGANGGNIRATVAGRHLYVAAEIPEPSGRITARSVGRNPAWEDEDLLRITAGADIGYTDRVVHVNPLGAYSLERAGRPVWTSLAIFPYSDEREAPVVPTNIDRFLVATQVAEKGWSVEVAFPLSELSAPGPDRIYASVERIRAQRPGSPQQTWRWPQIGPAEKIPVAAGVPWDAPAPSYRPAPLGNHEPPLAAGRVERLPALTSAWNEGAWAQVQAMELLRDEYPLLQPRVPGHVKLIHDGKTLAVMAHCEEPDQIQAQIQEADGAVTGDDSFQIYLSTSGSTYVQVAVNALGYLRDAVGFSGGPRISRPREWDSGARTHVQRESGAWTARIDVPLQQVAEALGEARPSTEWRVLLMRYRRGRPGEAREVSVLPVIQSDTPLATARYRRLSLSGSAAEKTAEPRAAAAPDIAWVLPPAERDRLGLAGMLDRHLRARVLKQLEADRDAWLQVDSRSSWERFRDPRINAMRRWLGDFPPREPLQMQVTKEYRGAGYRRQDVLYLSRPGLWITANLYLPEAPATPMPGIIIAPSHHRPRTQAELQDMGILWARAGAAVLVADHVGHGERIQTYPWNREGYRSRYTTGMQLYVAGGSLIKWIVWDLMRGVDLLLERPDIDKNKIIMLGAVAGGGDPAAITAAMDPRIAAVAPFTFGEATPELGPGGTRFETSLAEPGWGSWETTRNLPRSIVDRFLPWTICAAVAPRRFIYSYEMGWEVEKVPAWSRYRKVFGFFHAPENLDEAHGFGGFPGPGECANIGPSQRKTLYPELNRWFGIPIPEAEPDDRRPETELAALKPGVAEKLGMRMVHEVASELAHARVGAARAQLSKLDAAGRRAWLQRAWAARLGDIQPAVRPRTDLHWTKPWGSGLAEGLTLETEPGILVPMVILTSRSEQQPRSIVVVVSQRGKESLLARRRVELDALLSGGVAVCLPDLRGIGETSPDSRRSPSGQEISLAATELMLGNSLPGARLKDLRTVLAYLAARPDVDGNRIAVWGDSDAEVNPSRLMVDETPGWMVGPEIQHQAEPLGGLLALLAGLYEDKVRAVVVRRGLSGYLSILDDRFAYVPADVVVPDTAGAGDLADVAATLTPRPLLLDGLVDGRNRAAADSTVRAVFTPAISAYGDASALTIRTGAGRPGIAAWLLEALRR